MEQRDLRLVDGSCVAVIGGGPAGSFFSFFLLDLANRVAIRVDIYEPRDFTRPGPVGCNMCGGIISESKDGIGAAYRTAKAAAKTAVLQGISTANFAEHYRAACQRIETDNLIGEFVFFVTRQIQKWRFTRRAVLRMTTDEQSQDPEKRRMSLVLMGYFHGERTIQRDPYAHPGPIFLMRLCADMVKLLTTRR